MFIVGVSEYAGYAYLIRNYYVNLRCVIYAFLAFKDHSMYTKSIHLPI